MDLRSKMVLGVIPIIKPDPVVEFVVAAYSPGDGFVRIATVMPVITVEVGKAVSEIPAGKKKTDVMPVQNT